jgi:glycosyltransferase involved in cell wall biosynthesis
VPIVATNVGGTSDIATDGFDARLVPPRDVLALADVIEQTLVDREATAVRVRNARQRVEGPLSFAARNRALERIYEELVTNGAGATRRLAFV